MALDSHLQNLERLHLSARRLASADISDPRRAAARFGLTSREMEVLSLLAEGMLARSIAARLELSPRTVQKHLGNMYQKLGTHDRLLTVTRARQLGMLPTLWARGSALQTPV
jgi:DNA-binding NarL/FixJ family response regulator